MAQLGERDRMLLTLRFYENKTGPEAAALLGMREAAVHKRTTRALEKLRKYFTQRGVALSAAVIAGAISANSVQAAPVGLAIKVSVIAAKGLATTTTITTLVKGTLKFMAWTKVKFALGIGVTVLFMGSTIAIANVVVNYSNSLAALNILKVVEEKYVALPCIDFTANVLSELPDSTNSMHYAIRVGRPRLYRIESQSVNILGQTNNYAIWSAEGYAHEYLSELNKHYRKKLDETTFAADWGSLNLDTVVAKDIVPTSFFFNQDTNNPFGILESQAGQKNVDLLFKLGGGCRRLSEPFATVLVCKL
jgi:hypothetical protein